MASDMKIILTVACLISTVWQIEGVPYSGYNMYTGYSSRDTKLNSYLKNVLDPLKEQMKNGIPEYGLPVLEPLLLGNISKSIQNEKANATIFIQDLTVSGLSNFTLHELDAHLRNLTVIVRVIFPRILVTSERYKLTGIAAKIFPLIGEGRMSIQINEVEVRGDLTFSFPSSGSARLDHVELDVDFLRASVNFENILGGESLGDVVNAYLSSSAKKLYHMVKPKLLLQACEMFKQKANKALSKLNLSLY